MGTRLSRHLQMTFDLLGMPLLLQQCLLMVPPSLNKLLVKLLQLGVCFSKHFF